MISLKQGFHYYIPSGSISWAILASGERSNLILKMKGSRVLCSSFVCSLLISTYYFRINSVHDTREHRRSNLILLMTLKTSAYKLGCSVTYAFAPWLSPETFVQNNLASSHRHSPKDHVFQTKGFWKASGWESFASHPSHALNFCLACIFYGVVFAFSQ